MDQKSRKTKTKAINYCDPEDDDEDDFSCVRAPPSKKSRDGAKHAELKKSSSKSSNQESNSQASQRNKTRKSLVEKVLDRDLEAALALSLLNKADVKKEVSQGEGRVPKPLKDKSVELMPPVLSKFWEEVPVVAEYLYEGVDKPVPHILKTVYKEDGDNYTPILTPDCESDEDFSEPEMSEDEESTTKKVKKTSKTEKLKNQKPKRPLVSKKEKQPTKPWVTASTAARSPPANKSAAVRSAPSSTASLAKPGLAPSPAGARIPKWMPPGQIGRCPASVSPGPAVKSPGQGLRLGLSRLVRVKPLHPRVGSH